MVQATMTYGLRARAAFRPRRSQASLSAEDQHQPAAAATVGVGLRPGVMTKAELLRFSGRQTDYLNARNLILQKWDEDVTQYLSAQACTDAAEPGMEAIVTEAHTFLQEQGCINLGVPQDEPSQSQAQQEGRISNEELAEAVFDIVEDADFDKMTEKKIRKLLRDRFGQDMHDQKAFIREQVNKFMENGCKRPSSSKKAQKKEKAKGKVIVVGAGPAGLIAALHLKRCGVETVVLEARDRVGGRVHSYSGSGFSAPVDLGASIITGTATNVAKGLRPDPSTLIARQLGLDLYPVRTMLPIYDAVTGQAVSEDADKLVERVRDALLDDARERVDTLGEAATEAESLGAAIDRAYAARFAGAAPAKSMPAAGLECDPAAAARTPNGSADAEIAAATGPTGSAGAADAAAPVVRSETGKDAVVHDEKPERPAQGSAAEPQPEKASAVQSNYGNGDAEMHDAMPRPEADSGKGAGDAEAALSNGAATTGAAEEELQVQGAASDGDDAKVVDLNGGIGGIGSDDQKQHNCSDAKEDTAPPSSAVAAKAEAGPMTATLDDIDISIPEETSSAPSDTAHQAGVAKEHGSEVMPSVEPDSSAEAKAGQEVEVSEDSEETPLPASLSEAEQRLLDWHWSNLEYGCSASLDQVSLVHWNQDEEYGGFGGRHCMVVGGYDPILKALAERLDVRLSSPVTAISDTSDGVTVTIASGEEFEGAAVIITVPLGCLKTGDITFDPPLPPWKATAVAKLGFGDLNKVALEFPHAFWDGSSDLLGAAVPGGPASRGRCFMFWNLQPLCSKPILLSLVSGKAAYDSENMSDEDLSAAAMEVLRRMFGADIPEPVSALVTKWGTDAYAKGSYSYVAVGSSGKTYDALAAPVRRRVLWAGEHTCKEHPDTVGGAMLTGLREAVRALRLLQGEDDAAAAAAAVPADSIVAAKRRASREMEDEEDFLEDDSDEGQIKKKKKKQKAKKRRAEEEDEEDEPVEARKRRLREAAGDLEVPLTREELAAEQARREASRENTKLIVRILFGASVGDMEPLRALLSEATDTDKRGDILRAMLAANPDTLAAVAGDTACLRALDLWLLQLVPVTRAFHTMEQALQVLMKMPLRMDLLRVSGIAGTVADRVAAHPNRIVREAAARLQAHWAGRPAAPVQAAAPVPAQAPAQNGGGGGRLVAAAEADTGSEEDAAEIMDPDLLAKLAAAQQAEEEAAALAKKRAELEEEMARARRAAAGLPAILAFGEADRAKRNRAEKLAKGKNEDVASGSKGSGSKGHKEHTPGSSHKADPNVKKEVEKIVAEVLKPLYAEKDISKEDYKWVMQKSIGKILMLASEKGGDKILSSKRRPKLEVLVEKYVKQRKNDSS